MTVPDELVAIRQELIQVAAVAVAMIEDMDYGMAEVSDRTRMILGEIGTERMFQDNKWGPQHHKLAFWLSILLEEVGEVAKSLNDDLFFPTEQAELRLNIPPAPEPDWRTDYKPVKWGSAPADRDLDGLFDELRNERKHDDKDPITSPR